MTVVWEAHWVKTIMNHDREASWQALAVTKPKDERTDPDKKLFKDY